MKRSRLFIGLFSLASSLAIAQRVPVLNQIDLPHNYYFRELYLPQLTSGPSSVTWSPDGKQMIYSMAGSLWRQEIGSEKAIQLTDELGYDYQPDWSPNGKQVVFARYDGAAVELMILDLATGETKSLTSNQAVNMEPRWSPNGKNIAFVSTTGSRHFLLYQAEVANHELRDITSLIPDNRSTAIRYYYSAFDHAINPSWSPDGKKIYFISNREIIHGTGDIVSLDLETKERRTVHHEETSWRARPVVSPDGTRLVYSSYLGRNWDQLWMLPLAGGHPIPLTFGEFDNTAARWSPDGEKIAFISNRNGNTSLWVVNVFDGNQQPVTIKEFQYLRSHTLIQFQVIDENGNIIPARVSVTDSCGKFHAPHNAWIQADDSRYPHHQPFESHYFHSNGIGLVDVPKDKLLVQVSHGPEFEIIKLEVDAGQVIPNPFTVMLKRKSLPTDFGRWWSGDLHVHMNYGGHYRNTPEILTAQAEAENLNFVFNLIVNKEQRIPDVPYFSTAPDKASTSRSMILHSQEFHTSFWGHLGLLNLNNHLILPGYSGFPITAAASLFPHNGFVADKAHEQKALVGYVHPFEQSEVFPDQAPTLFNELPVDAALGKIDYYELIGFSNHKASEAVWYHLLNCGFRIPAGAGTDAMANYASLRGPVGLNRVYVKGEGQLDPQAFLKKVQEGKSFVTNGPLLGITVNGKTAGDSIAIPAKGISLPYSAFVRSSVPIDHFEIVWNGEVIATHLLSGNKTTADVTGTLKIKGTGWLLLRAWSEEGHHDLPDLYAYASTNPIYVQSPTISTRQKIAADYFLKWVSRVESKAKELVFRNENERNAVMKDIGMAKTFYLKRVN